MRREIKSRTGRLLDASDLTVAAPIKAGLVPSLDAVSYKTRAERLLQLLQLGRQGLHEFELTRVLSDAVERVGLIHAVRVGIIEPQNLLMLSVTFDGDWEPYMRTVWQKVSRLLDLIFCNTENYTLGWESSYDDWMRWLRSRQVSTPFLYSQPGLTFADGQLLRSQEWLQRQKEGQECPARLLHGVHADQVEFQLGSGDQNDARFPDSKGYATPRGGDFLVVRQSVRTLAALHRLTDVFLPGTHDGLVLHRAAREALSMLTDLMDGGSLPVTEQLSERFSDALAWIGQREPALPPTRVPPPLQDTLAYALPQRDWQDVQAGILAGLKADHGCALMLRFEHPVELADFFRRLPLTHHAKPFNDAGISVNLALSIEGLRLAGFTDDELRTWPDAFYEGMARRAGLLGDVRGNHPRQWRLPARLRDGALPTVDQPGDPELPPVQVAEMHALLTLRLERDRAKDQDDARQQLRDWLDGLKLPGRRLALQWLVRLVGRTSGETTEHFGWLDAQTDPRFDRAAASSKARDHSHVGEALCGHPNAADHRAPADDAPAARWLRNGSFLVVRKLRQDVGALNDAIDRRTTPALDGDLVRAKLMGRWHDGAKAEKPGTPLVAEPPPDPVRSNHFSFAGDPDGALCPLHAHIRRGNPRQPTGSLSNEPRDASPQAPVRPPRLLRRSMSYGPTYDDAPKNPDRGLFFMAYNASLAEQFELLQHWMSGANSSGGDSAHADPLLGVAMPGQARSCVFHHDDQLHRVTLEPAVFLNEEPHALVRLEWGAYWFAPALNVVADIARRAGTAREAPLWSAERGEVELQRLLALEAQAGLDAARLAWKEALEDPESLLDHRASSIWAAIRQFHDGGLRCAYGVLVGSPEGVHRIVKDETCYTATGYQDRMRNSFGVIFLGHDAGQADHAYESESAGVVEAIQALVPEDTYQRAKALTRDRLGELWRITEQAAKDADDLDWRLQFEVRELMDHMLGHLCIDWFGLVHGQHFDFGGLDQALGADDKPRNPGHFASPSRFFFQPRPSSDVKRIGEAHGQALRRAMHELLKSPDPEVQKALASAPLTQAVLSNPLAKDPEYVVRTAIGVVMGFVPTVDGTLRRALGEWLREGLFWRLRGAAPQLRALEDAAGSIGGHLIRAIQLRAAPELLWRTARVDHMLGSGEHAVQVRAGDRMVAGLMSATHHHWEQGSADLYAVFGGDRDAEDAPTHACPGTHAGFAVMLGFLAALLETQVPLQPGPAGLTFEAKGTRQRTSPPAERAMRGAAAKAAVPRSFNHPVRMLVVGDSWLAEGILTQFSLTRSLRERGYACAREHNLARSSFTLKSIAERAAAAASLAPDVQMVLVDGGGNDVHQRTGLFFKDVPQNPDWGSLSDQSHRSNLDDLLRGKGGGVALNLPAVDAFIDSSEGLAGKMRRTLEPLVNVRDGPPIVVVAYDHPIPDGRGLFGTKSEWLEPAFRRLGLDMTRQVDLDLATKLMAQLIDRVNDMNATVAGGFPDRVFPIRLTGTLNHDRTLWDNELHPNETGFGLLADKLVSLLPEKIPKPT